MKVADSFSGTVNLTQHAKDERFKRLNCLSLIISINDRLNANHLLPGCESGFHHCSITARFV